MLMLRSHLRAAFLLLLHQVSAIVAPPAWRALQTVPADLANRGKLSGTPPCLQPFKKQRPSRGRAATWTVARLLYDDHLLDIGVALDRNPEEPCCSLVFTNTSLDLPVGRVLLACPSDRESHLRGMEIRPSLRGRGLSKMMLAVWLALCAEAQLEARTREINKPLLSLSLARFGFEPTNGRGQVVHIRGRLQVDSTLGESTLGESAPAMRSAFVRTTFCPPQDQTALAAAINAALSGSSTRQQALRFAGPNGDLRRALTLRGGGMASPLLQCGRVAPRPTLRLASIVTSQGKPSSMGRRLVAPTMALGDDDQDETGYRVVAVIGLAAQPVVWVSLWFVATTGGGLPAGPFGVVGLIEGLSYLTIVGYVGAALVSKVRTGSGLPAGPSGLLGAAEGLSFVSVAAGLVVLAVISLGDAGCVPNALPLADYSERIKVCK